MWTIISEKSTHFKNASDPLKMLQKDQLRKESFSGNLVSEIPLKVSLHARVP